MNFYEHHLGDYIRDTAHLTLTEEGVYRRLLDQYFIREKPLPLDFNELRKLIRARYRNDSKTLKFILSEFFVAESDGYHQKRADDTIAAYKAKKIKAAASANARWKTSDRNANASEETMRSQCDRHAPSPQSPVLGEDLTLQPHAQGSMSLQRATPANGTHAPGSEIEIFETWNRIKIRYPPSARVSWIAAEKFARQIVLDHRATWPQLEAGVERYRLCCESRQREPMNPSRFFGDIDAPWEQDWPPANQAESPMDEIRRANSAQ